MPIQLNRFPTYNIPVESKGDTDKTWYTFWAGLFKGQPMGVVSVVTVGQSPFSYTSPSGGTMVIQGGTVSLVSITRDGVTNFNTGQTQGMFPMSQGDILIVTYSAVPNMTFIPR